MSDGVVMVRLLTALLIAAIPFAAFGADARVAVVGVVGDAKVGSQTIEPLQLLERGDRLKLPAGARLHLVWLDTGRTELWKGKAVLVVEENGCDVKKPRGGTPGAPELGARVGSHMGSLFEAMARTTLGEDPGRGAIDPAQLKAAELQEISDARETYEQVSETRTPGDLLPEVILAGVLLTYGQVEEAGAVIERAEERCDCDQPRTLRLALTAEED